MSESRGGAAHRAAQSMPRKKPMPRAEDLALPTEAAQLEIVVLLVEGKVHVFRDLLPAFGGSDEAAGEALWELDEAGFTVPAPVVEEDDGTDAYLDYPVAFTEEGRTAAEAITVTYNVRGRRVVEIQGSDGTVYTAVRSSNKQRTHDFDDD